MNSEAEASERITEKGVVGVSEIAARSVAEPDSRE